MGIVPAFVRNNIQWWHPDALSVLSVTLVIIFLRRDEFHFGKYYLLAAAACGVSIGIKFAGVFFILAIPYYLVMGYLQKRITIKQALGKSVLFIAIAILALVVSNPFLYNAGARQELARIQTEKVEVLKEGYEDPSPYYQRGPQFWEWTLSNWYGHPLFLIFLGFSLVVGCLWGENRWLNRLILAYILPQSIYLLWFVAVKPDHYWLPVMVPLFSTSLIIPKALVEGWLPRIPVKVRRWLLAGLIIILILQALVFLIKPYSGVLVQFQNGLKIESMLGK